MLAKWENKLGGAQEFMETHCYTMGEALRIVPDVALTQRGTLHTSDYNFFVYIL